MIWYTEACSLVPVAMRRLLGETSQHMTDIFSGTWEDQGAQHGGGASLTRVCPFKCGPYGPFAPGLRASTAPPPPSQPPWYLELQGSCGHAVDADQGVHPHAHPPLAWKEAEGYQVRTGS